MPAPGSRPNLDPQRQGQLLPFLAGQEEGQLEGGGRAGGSGVRDAGCRMLCGPAPRSLLGGPAGAGWLPGTQLALSHTCTVARQLERSCNTSMARARMFLFPSRSKSLLGSCSGI